MSSRLDRIVTIMAIVGWVLLPIMVALWFWYTAITAPKANAAPTGECPAGSYNIGISKTNEPLCKLYPTGCIHGDSIPLSDCPQHNQNDATYSVEPQLSDTLHIGVGGK